MRQGGIRGFIYGADVNTLNSFKNFQGKGKNVFNSLNIRDRKEI